MNLEDIKQRNVRMGALGANAPKKMVKVRTQDIKQMIYDDVPALVAEVERLRIALADTRSFHAKKGCDNCRSELHDEAVTQWRMAGAVGESPA